MKAQVCPSLGLSDDSETSFSYPSPENHCFRAIPISALKLEYQRKYCLSGNHTECELFRGEAGRSPKHFSGAAHRSGRGSPTYRKLLLGLFILLGGAAGIAWLVLSRPGGILNPPPVINSEVPPTVSIENTKTPPPDTATPSPSFTIVMPTPTMLVVHALDVPIGTLNPLVIHRVSEGENLSSLARTYNTTNEAITALNYNLFYPPLWIDAVIVIPLNQVNVNDLPLFQAYQVTESIALRNLAANFSVDIEMLKVYNQVDSEYVFNVGEWVLIPHPRVATPTG